MILIVRDKNKFFIFRSVLDFEMWYNYKCQELQLKNKNKKKVEKFAFRSVLN